jgi:hypothetical protein
MTRITYFLRSENLSQPRHVLSSSSGKVGDAIVGECIVRGMLWEEMGAQDNGAQLLHPSCTDKAAHMSCMNEGLSRHVICMFFICQASSIMINARAQP